MFGYFGCSTAIPSGSWSFPYLFGFAGHLSPLAQLLEIELARLELWDDCISLYDGVSLEAAAGAEPYAAPGGWGSGKAPGGYHGSELGIPHQFPGNAPYYADFEA